MHRNAPRRLYLQSWRVEALTEKLLRQKSWRLLLTVRARLTVPTAGHERKHNACRADIGGCVSGYTYIRRVKSPQNVCRGSVEECNQAHAGTCPQNQVKIHLIHVFPKGSVYSVLNSAHYEVMCWHSVKVKMLERGSSAPWGLTASH